MEDIDKSIIAILLSAGSGSRMKSQDKKQFLLLNDVPVFIWSIKTFLKLAETKSVKIILVHSPGDLQRFQELLKNHLGDSAKLIDLVEGGKTRSDSVYHGLKLAQPQSQHDDFVLIHDCARPFVRLTDINRLIEELATCEAATLGYQITDTIKSINPDNGDIHEHLNRDILKGILTPQGFHFSLIWKAYEQYINNPYSVTDDTKLIQDLGYPVKVVEGAKTNIKITTPEDLPFANFLIDTLS